MWNYEKKLQYPVRITTPNAKAAQIIITQFGGPDGELAASMRYLSQRYTMPYKDVYKRQDKDGYVPVRNLNVPVFDGIVSIQGVSMRRRCV